MFSKLYNLYGKTTNSSDPRVITPTTIPIFILPPKLDSLSQNTNKHELNNDTLDYSSLAGDENASMTSNNKQSINNTTSKNENLIAANSKANSKPYKEVKRKYMAKQNQLFSTSTNSLEFLNTNLNNNTNINQIQSNVNNKARSYNNSRRNINEVSTNDLNLLNDSIKLNTNGNQANNQRSLVKTLFRNGFLNSSTVSNENDVVKTKENYCNLWLLHADETNGLKPKQHLEKAESMFVDSTTNMNHKSMVPKSESFYNQLVMPKSDEQMQREYLTNLLTQLESEQQNKNQKSNQSNNSPTNFPKSKRSKSETLFSLNSIQLPNQNLASILNANQNSVNPRGLSKRQLIALLNKTNTNNKTLAGGNTLDIKQQNDSNTRRFSFRNFFKSNKSDSSGMKTSIPNLNKSFNETRISQNQKRISVSSENNNNLNGINQFNVPSIQIISKEHSANSISHSNSGESTKNSTSNDSPTIRPKKLSKMASLNDSTYQVLDQQHMRLAKLDPNTQKSLDLQQKQQSSVDITGVSASTNKLSTIQANNSYLSILKNSYSNSNLAKKINSLSNTQLDELLISNNPNNQPNVSNQNTNRSDMFMNLSNLALNTLNNNSTFDESDCDMDKIFNDYYQTNAVNQRPNTNNEGKEFFVKNNNNNTHNEFKAKRPRSNIFAFLFKRNNKKPKYDQQIDDFVTNNNELPLADSTTKSSRFSLLAKRHWSFRRLDSSRSNKKLLREQPGMDEYEINESIFNFDIFFTNNHELNFFSKRKEFKKQKLAFKEQDSIYFDADLISLNSLNKHAQHQHTKSSQIKAIVDVSFEKLQQNQNGHIISLNLKKLRTQPLIEVNHIKAKLTYLNIEMIDQTSGTNTFTQNKRFFSHNHKSTQCRTLAKLSISKTKKCKFEKNLKNFSKPIEFELVQEHFMNVTEEAMNIQMKKFRNSIENSSNIITTTTTSTNLELNATNNTLNNTNNKTYLFLLTIEIHSYLPVSRKILSSTFRKKKRIFRGQCQIYENFLSTTEFIKCFNLNEI